MNKQESKENWTRVRKMIIARQQDLGLSNHDISLFTGINIALVGRYLKADVIPSTVSFFQLCAAVDISVNLELN